MPVDGELRVALKGRLAAILGLCQNSKKPGTISRDGLAQLELVAGARNHRQPHSRWIAHI
ncbi:MAG: hypothetical protein RIM84_16595 [Alphaproteobacteria bacterium]